MRRECTTLRCVRLHVFLAVVSTSSLSFGPVQSTPLFSLLLSFLFPNDSFLRVYTTDQFPEDFSIMVTLRPDQGSSSVLFGLYSDSGEDQLLVEVGDTVRFFYQDQNGMPAENHTLEFGAAINDGKWVTTWLNWMSERLWLCLCNCLCLMVWWWAGSRWCWVDEWRYLWVACASCCKEWREKWR